MTKGRNLGYDAGTFDDLSCSIAGHTEPGMKGTIIIK